MHSWPIGLQDFFTFDLCDLLNLYRGSIATLYLLTVKNGVLSFNSIAIGLIHNTIIVEYYILQEAKIVKNAYMAIASIVEADGMFIFFCSYYES